MITTTYQPLVQAQANAERAHAEYLREATIGISPGAMTAWYGEWAFWAAVVARMVDRYCRTAAAMGICTVCEREGFEPDELDASARCEECRP